jgi:preprotein translocase subunit SecY
MCGFTYHSRYPVFSVIKSLFRVPEIRQKIVLTLVLLAVYRLGFSIVLAVVNQELLADSLKDRGDGGGVDSAIALLSILSASNVGMMTIFGLGIMPYISASIVFQLLATVYPPLEALQKEGDVGRRKIAEYTRYATVAICLMQSFVWMRMLTPGEGGRGSLVWPQFNGIYFQIVCSVTMTAGSTLLMWIAEQIDEYGIGNGVSLIIMAGILARVPEVVRSQLQPALKQGISIGSDSGLERFAVLLFLFVGVIACVVLVTQAQRRIPVHSAKHVRGSRQFAGQRQFLPLRVNQSGVMPVIFASSLIVFPMMLLRQISGLVAAFPSLRSVFDAVESTVADSNGLMYNLLYVSLIYFFCYFWSAVTFNPLEVANNLREYGSFVPGYRPGSRTAAYLQQVISRMNFLGAAFLSVLALIPVFVMNSMHLDYLTASFFGGTGLLICVSVIIDLVQKIDSYLLVSNQPTLLVDSRRS